MTRTPISQHQPISQTRGQSTVPKKGFARSRRDALPPPFEHRSIVEVVLVDQLVDAVRKSSSARAGA